MLVEPNIFMTYSGCLIFSGPLVQKKLRYVTCDKNLSVRKNIYYALLFKLICVMDVA
jgi:hypothetical protein